MGLGQSTSRSPSREELPAGHLVMDVYEPAGSPLKRGRKRKTSKEKEVETKKIAKLDTAYVYQTLFIQGVNSDIVISACGREWHVHKVYLKQAKYFESMFDGVWAEAKSGRVSIEIADPSINADGLNAVLGSLYNNEIEIDLEKIEGTLAAASYLVLNSVIERCAEMMAEALSIENAINFLDLSTRYGLNDVREQSRGLLLHNFWKIMNDRSKLKQIDRGLMITLLNSPNLFICEGEYDIYKTIKQWIYMRECPNCNLFDSPEVFSTNVSKFLENSETDYLLTKYMDILSSIRFEKILLSSETIKIIKNDGLIPKSIIDEMTSALWMSLLENEETPKTLEISDEDFFKRCFRLGRALESVPKCWRWTGFNSGVDILLHLNDYSVCIKRNCLNQKAPYSVSLKSKHLLHYRLVVCDSNGHVVNDSGKATWDMAPDEAKTIFRITEETVVPLSVHFQFLIQKPIDSTQYYLNKYLREKETNQDNFEK
uniref:BTB domain-containing protein n=1 Tax=Caenorhabditis tropicalis TaxID=1561998 RepID=A0A1I7TE30_9PELO